MVKSAAMLGLISAILAGSAGAAAANPFIIEPEKPAFTATFGGRYWYGMGSTSKDLYGLTRDTLNSRLTYSGLQSHSLELYGRIDHDSGLFWKGYIGGGLLTKGSLQDEDFPPGIAPYSSTSSTLQNQSFGYIDTDVGGAILRGRDFRLDGFVGYHYMHWRLKAFGCTQTATNTGVCTPSISDSTAVIVEDDTWQGVRVGLNADLPIYDKWRIGLEGAYLPYVWLSGSDNHLLRTDFAGPIPQSGHGWGYQLEAILSYQLTETVSLGLGGRYWHMQSQGTADFTGVTAGGTTQPLDFKADIYGVFFQGSYRFNNL